MRALLAGLAALAPAVAAPPLRAQDTKGPRAADVKPYALDEILELVRSKVPNKKILAYAKDDCIDFALDGGTVAQLQRAGADDALLDGMKGACRPKAGAAARATRSRPAPPVASRAVTTTASYGTLAPSVAAATPSGWAKALGSVPTTAAARARAGVFLVTSVRGRGTGFLVDPSGLVMTSARLVDGEEDVRVLLDSVTWVRPRVLELDRARDVAVLRVRAARCGGCAPLRPAAAAAGTRLFAVSAPATRGGVSSGALPGRARRAGDIPLARRQLGAPLLTGDGRVVAIATAAGDSLRAVPLRDVTALVSRFAGGRGPAAPDSVFPVLPPEVFPAAPVAAARQRSNLDLAPYARQLGAFRVVVMPPQVAAYRQARAVQEAAARGARGEPTIDGHVDPIQAWDSWADLSQGRRPVVVVSVAPRAKGRQTGLGRGEATLPWFGAHEVREFLGDVQRVVMVRDDEVVVPVEQVRLPAALNAADYRAKQRTLPSQLVQLYRAEDFAPRPDGRPPRIRMLIFAADGRVGAKIYEIDRRVVTAAWEDLEAR